MLKEALEKYGDFAKVRFELQNLLLILKGAGILLLLTEFCPESG